jgi:hypothetical protein
LETNEQSKPVLRYLEFIKKNISKETDEQLQILLNHLINIRKAITERIGSEADEQRQARLGDA